MNFRIFQHSCLPSFFIGLILTIISISTNAQCVDEQYSHGVLTTDDFGQSFTTSPSGCGSFNNLVVERLNGPFGNINALTATFELFSGQTISGTPLYTQTGIAISAGAGDKTITLSGGTGSLALSPSTQYTWYLTLSVASDWRFNNGDAYAGGHAYRFGSAKSDMDIDMIINALPLPVELIAFDAEQENTSVKLTWQTASEEINAGFEVQRSNNGNPDSYREWETIDFVEGNGTTQEVQNYTYTDEEPFTGINYYRLKQIDYDGQFEYSKIVNINQKSSNTSTIQLFPNPVKDELNIIDGQGQATIYNMLGQPVKQFTVNNETSSIDVSDLPKGQYILHIQQENGTVATKRFVK